MAYYESVKDTSKDCLKSEALKDAVDSVYQKYSGLNPKLVNNAEMLQRVSHHIYDTVCVNNGTIKFGILTYRDRYNESLKKTKKEISYSKLELNVAIFISMEIFRTFQSNLKSEQC